MNKNLHKIMYGLFFPAVLGTILVQFISEDLSKLKIYPRLLLGMLFLIHWSFEYVTESNRDRIFKYNAWKYFTGIALIIVIYLVFLKFPIYNPNAANSYSGFYLLASLLPAVFLIEYVGDILFSYNDINEKYVPIDLFLFFSLFTLHLLGKTILFLLGTPVLFTAQLVSEHYCPSCPSEHIKNPQMGIGTRYKRPDGSVHA